MLQFTVVLNIYLSYNMCMETPSGFRSFTDFLFAYIAMLMRIISSLMDENRLLNEKVQYLLQQRFGAKSERTDPKQLSLFDDTHLSDGSTQEKPTVQVGSHTRRPGGRRFLPKNLRRVEVVIDVPEEKKQCSCGQCKIQIAEERSEHLNVKPPEFWVEEIIRPIYACSCCDIGPIIAPLPPAPLPRTQTSPSLLAYIGTSKFVDGLPLYRQAQILKHRFGIPITSTTLADWMIKSATRLLNPLIQAMLPHLYASDYWNMDETRVQVLHEEGRTAHQLSWFWVRRSAWGIPVVLFDYSPSRSGKTAMQLLEGFSGIGVRDFFLNFSIC